MACTEDAYDADDYGCSFTSPDFPNGYDDCLCHVASIHDYDSNAVFEMRFDVFQLDSEGDVVTVYDGQSVIAELTGADDPSDLVFVTNSGELRIELRSDGYGEGNSPGYRAFVIKG